MEELLEQLKQARQAEEKAYQFVKDCEAELIATIEYSGLEVAKNILVQTRNKLELIDSQVRQEAIDLYGLTGNKHPHEKVSIAVSLEPLYEEKDAIVWAINNALDMLKLDSKRFEKHAKAVLKTVPLPFVKVEEKASVRIAREL